MANKCKNTEYGKKKLTGVHTFRKIREWLKLGTKSLEMLAFLKFGPPQKMAFP